MNIFANNARISSQIPLYSSYMRDSKLIKSISLQKSSKANISACQFSQNKKKKNVQYQEQIAYDEASKGFIKFKPAILPKDDRYRQVTINPLTGAEQLQELDEDDENDDEDLPLSEAGKHLLALSKTRYRTIPDLPIWFREKQREILAGRSNSQIRRCLKNWMIKYEYSYLQKFLNHPFHFFPDSKKYDLANRHPIPRETEKSIRYLYGPDETIAYCYFHLPSRYMVTRRILQDLKLHYSNGGFTPKRVLDFGCGPATAAAVIRDLWPEESSSSSSSSGTAASTFAYHGIEISQSMIDAAQKMCKDIVPNATFWTKTGDIMTRCLQKGERYDLIIASYTFSELYNDETRRLACQLLYELLEPNGYILFLEIGNPFGSHIVRTIRQYLLHLSKTVDKYGEFEQYQDNLFDPNDINKKGDDDDDGQEDIDTLDDEDDDNDKKSAGKKSANGKKEIGLDKFKQIKKDAKSQQQQQQPQEKSERPISYNRLKEQDVKQAILPPPKGFFHDDFQATVIAPCTHDGLCNLKKNTFCSFAQRVPNNGLARKEGEEKFSYVLIQKRVTPEKQEKLGQEEEGKGELQSDSDESEIDEDDEDDENRDYRDEVSRILNEASEIRNDEKSESGSESDSSSVNEEEEKENGGAEEAADEEEEKEDPDRLYELTPYEIIKEYIHYVDTDNTKGVVALTNEMEDVLWKGYDPVFNRDEYGRLIRSPVKERGQVILDICMPSSEVTRYTHSKSMLKAFPALYRGIRKSQWGGLIPMFMDESIEQVKIEKQQEKLKKLQREQMKEDRERAMAVRIAKQNEKRELKMIEQKQLGSSSLSRPRRMIPRRLSQRESDVEDDDDDDEEEESDVSDIEDDPMERLNRKSRRIEVVKRNKPFTKVRKTSEELSREADKADSDDETADHKISQSKGRPSIFKRK